MTIPGQASRRQDRTCRLPGPDGRDSKSSGPFGPMHHEHV